MTSTHDRILQAAPRNTELLEGLHATESAPSQLYQQIQYLQDLHEQSNKTAKNVERLKSKTAQELNDHKKYNESTFRRFAHKASGRTEKFNEKAAREEKEYFEAIQAQRSAEDELNYVRQLIAEAEEKKQAYEKEANLHSTYQRDLDALYNSIFTGHTPEFPEGAQRERAVEETNGRLQTVQQRLEKERHVLDLIKKLCGRLLDAKRLLMTAHDMATRDMFSDGMSQSNNCLQQADSSVRQARMLSQQLRQIDPKADVQGLGAVDVHIGDIWSDIVFVNGFSDGDMRARIRRAETQIDWALQKGARVMKGQQVREKELVAEVGRVAAELRERRVELQWSREEAFRRVTGGEQVGERVMPRVGGEDEAPPAYSRR